MATKLNHQFMWSNGEKPVRSYKKDKPVGEKINFNNRMETIDNYYTTNPHDNAMYNTNNQGIYAALNVTEKVNYLGAKTNDKLTRECQLHQ